MIVVLEAAALIFVTWGQKWQTKENAALFCGSFAFGGHGECWECETVNLASAWLHRTRVLSGGLTVVAEELGPLAPTTPHYSSSRAVSRKPRTLLSTSTAGREEGNGVCLLLNLIGQRPPFRRLTSLLFWVVRRGGRKSQGAGVRQGLLVPHEAMESTRSWSPGAVKWEHVSNSTRDGEGQTSLGTREVSHREQPKSQMLDLQSIGWWKDHSRLTWCSTFMWVWARASKKCRTTHSEPPCSVVFRMLRMTRCCFSPAGLTFFVLRTPKHSKKLARTPQNFVCGRVREWKSVVAINIYHVEIKI